MMTDFIEDFPAATPTFDFDLIAQSLVPLLRQDTKEAYSKFSLKKYSPTAAR